MKLEEFNNLTLSCRCWFFGQTEVFEIPGYEARAWAMRSISLFKDYPHLDWIRPLVSYDTDGILFIGDIAKLGRTFEEVKP